MNQRNAKGTRRHRKKIENKAKRWLQANEAAQNESGPAAELSEKQKRQNANADAARKYRKKVLEKARYVTESEKKIQQAAAEVNKVKQENDQLRAQVIRLEQILATHEIKYE